MAKISSQDCIDFAVRMFPELADLQPGKRGWTRTKKFRTPSGVMRYFNLFPQSGRIRGSIGYWNLNVLESSDDGPGELSASLAVRRFNDRGKEIDDDGMLLPDSRPEKDRLPPDPKMAKPSFIYAVITVEEVEGPVFVINTVSCWKKMKCLTDYYTNDERKLLQPLFDRLGLNELMESQYETDGTKTEAEIRGRLEAAGILFDVEFQKWIDRPAGEE